MLYLSKHPIATNLFVYHHFNDQLDFHYVQVGSLNFDSNYQNEDVPVTPVGDGDNDGVLHFHVIDDIFTKPGDIYDKVAG